MLYSLLNLLDISMFQLIVCLKIAEVDSSENSRNRMQILQKKKKKILKSCFEFVSVCTKASGIV